MILTREEAIKLLKENIKNENLIKHSLAVEAVMKGLARHFSEDVEKWGLSGLLHDIDYGTTQDDLSQHSLVGSQILQDIGIDSEICRAVKVHNEMHGILPETLMEKALYVVDPLTGLMVAATLVLPSKKIADLKGDSVLNRFKEKAFAKGANREIISKCKEYLGLDLPKFFGITLQSMQEVAQDLGL